MNSKITSEKGSSRRDFIVNAGLFTAGAIAAGGVVGALSPRKAEAAAPPLPWPYPAGGFTALELQAMGEAAYGNYSTAGGCMSATGKALVDALVMKLGSAADLNWATFNNDFWRLGSGGINGWGTFCGAANAGVAIINMAAASTAVGALVNEFLGWYCDFAFPTTMWDTVSLIDNQQTTVCRSPLCHQSVGEWCHATGYSTSSNEKKARCAKVAADCAYKVAQLLNAWKAGTITYSKTGPDYQADVESERCFSCHQVSPNDYTQGRMDCLECHPDKVCHNQER